MRRGAAVACQFQAIAKFSIRITRPSRRHVKELNYYLELAGGVRCLTDRRRPQALAPIAARASPPSFAAG
jgi:hypothetical protein